MTPRLVLWCLGSPLACFPLRPSCSSRQLFRHLIVCLHHFCCRLPRSIVCTVLAHRAQVLQGDTTLERCSFFFVHGNNEHSPREWFGKSGCGHIVFCLGRDIFLLWQVASPSPDRFAIILQVVPKYKGRQSSTKAASAAFSDLLDAALLIFLRVSSEGCLPKLGLFSPLLTSRNF